MEVGIDIETIKPRRQWQSIVNRYFSKKEQQVIHAAKNHPTRLVLSYMDS